MAAVIGASACTGTSSIIDIDPVSKSWPGFFEEMKQVGGKIDVVSVR